MLNRTFAAEGTPTLEMRIGVESGEVLVDQHRASGPRDRMLTGDAVNVAARLEASASPSEWWWGRGPSSPRRRSSSTESSPRSS